MKKLISPFQQIKKAVDIFSKKENLIFLVKIYLPLIFFPIISIAFAYIPFFTKNTDSGWFIALTVVVRVIDLVLGVFVTLSAILTISKTIEGEVVPVKKIFEDAWKRYWIFLLLNVSLAILYFLGFLLLIIPGIVISVWLAFARFIMIEREMGIKESILKSKEMVKGIFWKVLWRLVIFGLFSVLSEFILTSIPFGIGSVIWTLCGGLFLLPYYFLYKEISA